MVFITAFVSRLPMNYIGSFTILQFLKLQQISCIADFYLVFFFFFTIIHEQEQKMQKF